MPLRQDGQSARPGLPSLHPDLCRNDTNAAIDELLEAFIHPVAEEHCSSLLTGLDKTALLELARALELAAVRSSWAKARLTEALTAACSFEQLQAHLELADYLVRGHAGTLDFLLYLYFGKTHRDLKSFALRDLGLVAVNGRDASGARFVDAAEAQSSFLYSRLSATLGTAESIELASAALLSEAPPPTTYVARLRDRLALQVGMYFEKAGEPGRALDIYRTTDDPACNERQVRLLQAAGRSEECRALLERLIDDPGSDAEYDFATEFYACKFKRRRLGACTALLRDSQSIEIDEAYRTTPEEGAAAWFGRDGWTAYWTESGVWLALFGLVFWEQLFGTEALPHTGFDRLPRSLADRSFHAVHEASIRAQIELIRSGGAAALVQTVVDRHRGAVNGLVNWDEIDGGAVEALAAGSSGCDARGDVHGLLWFHGRLSGLDADPGRCG